MRRWRKGLAGAFVQVAYLGPNPKATNPNLDLARCFVRLANLTSYPLDRLSRYEAVLWRQAGQILFALDALDRRKPQDRNAVSVSRIGNLMPMNAKRINW